MSTQVRQAQQEEHHPERSVYPVWCCCPPSRYSGYFWGAALVLLGGAWLLHNIGWISGSWNEVLLPAIVVGLGLLYLSEARTGR